MKLELYYYNQCPFCMMVLTKINQLGLQDKIEMKNTLTDSKNNNDHQQRSGRTTVPCLYIDGEPLFESSDIVNWLQLNKDKI